MSHPSKKVIQDRAISGLTVQGSDVASVTKLKEGHPSLCATCGQTASTLACGTASVALCSRA